MKRTWDIEELIEHFTLVPPELELLGNKTGATRLGFEPDSLYQLFSA